MPGVGPARWRAAQRIYGPMLDEAPGDKPAALWLTPDGLELRDLAQTRWRALRVDFATPAWRRRLAAGKGLLERAVGTPRSDDDTLLDATAGLGSDSFLLAALGYRVTALERHALPFALFHDALRRAACHPKLAAISSGIELCLGRAEDWLSKLAPRQRPRVVYLDPMYESGASGAAPKRQLQYLRRLLPVESLADQQKLLAASRQCATQRVVVKRPRLAEPLLDDVSYSVRGKSVRFDVYLVNPAEGVT